MRRLKPAIETLFARIDSQLSPWRVDSAISRFNRGVAGKATNDPELKLVTSFALEIASKSGGAFDPTVGPLVARWGFGPIQHGGPPDWRGISLGPQGILKARPDLTLDLCGIAKGWAMDQAVILLRSEGQGDFLFDLGGEFAAHGQHPDGRLWRIGVEAPVPGRGTPTTLHLPSGLAVATSGTRAQSYVLNGRLYTHIIDPMVKAPAAGRLRSVTVVAADGISADGWATALFAAGEIEGPKLAEAEGMAAIFQFEEDGSIQRIATKAISELIR
jgi:thiamine biosynthesis lipoprotein